eukprot:COSAG02_NODE_1647_length_11517_cov_2.751533_16_plen_95_part_00
MNTYSSGVNLHTLGAFDRWFEHAGFVNLRDHSNASRRRSLTESSHVSSMNRFRFREGWLRPERDVILWDENISWRRLGRSWRWLRHVNERERND